MNYCKLLGLWLMTFLGLSLKAQEKLEPDALKQDYELLNNITIGLSPKLTAEDQDRLEQLAKVNMEALADQKFTVIEFFNFLAEVDFDTKFDEHATLSLTEEVFTPFLLKSKLFPVPIVLMGTTAVVNATGTSLPYGAILHSVNGIAVEALLKDFTDEYLDTFVQRRLEGQFSLLYLLKMGSQDTFQIEYSAPDATDERMNKTVAGIDFETYRKLFSEAIYPLNDDQLGKLINTEYYESSRAYYLQLNSFNWDNTSKKGLLHFLNSDHNNFERRFDEIFNEVAIKQAEHLIIDLRFNSGGDLKVPRVLYRYIAQKPFMEDILILMADFEIPHMDAIIRISDEEIDDPKEVERFVKRYRKQFEEGPDGRLLWPFVAHELVEPAKNAFKGKVYLLVGGRSISAAAYFAALFQYDQRGPIIGEEMGGSFRALSAGQLLTFQLPHSKLELEAPIMEVNFAKHLSENIPTDRIVPDIQFSDEERYAYHLLMKDIGLEKVLELIKSER